MDGQASIFKNPLQYPYRNSAVIQDKIYNRINKGDLSPSFEKPLDFIKKIRIKKPTITEDKIFGILSWE